MHDIIEAIYPHVMSSQGWMPGLSAYYQAILEKHDSVVSPADLSLFSPKQVVWKLMLPSVFDLDVFIADTSLGAISIDLSRSFRRILVYAHNEKAASIIEKRMTEAHIENVFVLNTANDKELQQHGFEIGVSIFVLSKAILSEFGKNGCVKRMQDLMDQMSGLWANRHSACILYPKALHVHFHGKIPWFYDYKGIGGACMASIKKRYGFEHASSFDFYHSPGNVTEISMTNPPLLRFRRSISLKHQIKNWPVVLPSRMTTFSRVQRPMTWLETMMEEVNSHSAIDSPLRVHRYFAGNPFMILLELSSPSGREYICRLPVGRKISRKRARHNYDTLLTLQEKNKLGRYFPKPGGKGLCHDQPYYIEEKLEGEPTVLTRENFSTIYPSVRRLLFFFYQALGRTTLIDDSTFDTLVGNNLAVLNQFVRGGKDLDRMSVLHAYLKEKLMGKTMQLPFVHGDFKIENMLFRKNELAGLFDWDLSVHAGFPFIDLFYFVGYSFYHWADAHDRILSHYITPQLLSLKHEPLLSQCMDDYALELGIADEYKRISGIMFWIHYLVNTTGKGFATNSAEVYDTFFKKPLSVIVDEIMSTEA